MNLLAVDAGNSRIKWKRHDGNIWREQEWTPTADPQLETQWRHLPKPESVIVANVAGASAEAAIRAACRNWNLTPEIVGAQAARCGVSNGYADPERLGADRWAALIGARHLYPGRDLLVVQSGTAVTIDTLTAEGCFRGGLILPGLNAMLDTLARHAARLERQSGRFARFPDNTADAMFSGAVSAIAGAVERAHRQIAGHALCLLGGGDADILLPWLDIPVQKTDNLVLEGLLRIATTEKET